MLNAANNLFAIKATGEQDPMSDRTVIEDALGREGQRPRLIIPHTQLEVYCEIIAAATLIGFAAYLAAIWTKLPAQIPVHFNIMGQPDRWGSRNTHFSLFGVMAALYIGISILQRFPQIYNYPFGLTPQNVYRQYQLARQLLTLIKTEIVCLFCLVQWETVLAARERSHALGIWLIPVMLLAILGAIVHYFVQASKAK
jgi:uncharacterized membrane protein